jgi:hypothetical protein
MSIGVSIKDILFYVGMDVSREVASLIEMGLIEKKTHGVLGELYTINKGKI